jgi:tetratricopeptide (TPR) repeat protein
MSEAMESNEVTGRIEEIPLPRLLLTLLDERFGGALTLSRDRIGKRFLFHRGAPVFAESNLASESLGVQLMDAGMLDRKGFNRAAAHIERTGAKEGAALLELKLIEPKDLFTALKEQVHIRLMECFGWTRGEFFLDDTAVTPGDAQPFRIDVLAAVQDGIEAYWNSERVIAELSCHMDQFPSLRPGKEKLAARLRSDDALEATLEALDGTLSLWKVMQVAHSPRARAAAWVLDAIGAIAYREQARPARAGNEAPEIEILVTNPQTSSVPLPGAASGRDRLDELRREIATASADATSSQPEPSADTASAALETLSEKIRSKHAKIEAAPNADHYAILEVPEDAEREQIRRAYLLAAKTYHPDALARCGLAPELRAQASSVFARIGKAHALLADPEARKRYDSTRAENATDLDAERLAQAETLYRKGEVLMRAGNFRGAIEFLKPATEIWPEECAYQSTLGWALYKKSPPEPERAREHLTLAAQLEPGDGVTLFRMSVVLRELGDLEGSEEAATRAEELTR